MEEPPSFVGAVKETVAWALPPVAETLVGALGTVIGVTGLLAPDAEESPTALVALTVKV